MRKVLIVEPRAADARALKRTLREAGLVTSSTVLKNGTDAKRHVAERDHDCIVFLNIHTPEGEWAEFLEWLRTQTFCRNVLVIAVGERSQLRGVVQACERGARTFVIKPVHVEDLKSLVRDYPDHWGRAPE
jgi:DNA-binding NtrC family response regulator